MMLAYFSILIMEWGFEVDLNSQDCVMFTTNVQHLLNYDRSIQTKNSGFSFEPEFELSLNNMSFL